MNALAERETKQELVPSDFLSEWIRRGTLLSLILDGGKGFLRRAVTLETRLRKPSADGLTQCILSLVIFRDHREVI